MDVINIIIIAAMLKCSNPPLKRMCKLNVHLCIPWKCSVPSSIVIIQHTTILVFPAAEKLRPPVVHKYGLSPRKRTGIHQLTIIIGSDLMLMTIMFFLSL